MSLPKHIILIGFKHVGKTVVGRHLAKTLHVPFVDLDHQIELHHAKNCSHYLTCRQIMEQHSEAYFRDLEIKTLEKIMQSKPSVISFGGGTPLGSETQAIIKKSSIVHITAPKGIVFERIRMGGRPAFFNPEEDMIDSFNRLWEERRVIYNGINDITILNNGSLEETTEQIIDQLQLGQPLHE